MDAVRSQRVSTTTPIVETPSGGPAKKDVEAPLPPLPLAQRRTAPTAHRPHLLAFAFGGRLNKTIAAAMVSAAMLTGAPVMAQTTDVATRPPVATTATPSRIAQHAIVDEEAEKRLLEELRTTVLANPNDYSFGEVARALTITKRIEHRHQADEASGQCGVYRGTRRTGNPEVAKNTIRTDCITFPLEVLRDAFTLRGESDKWDAALSRAIRESREAAQEQGLSKDKWGLRGTVLMRVMIEDLGWSDGMLFSPDVKNPWDGQSYHPQTLRYTAALGHYVGVPLDTSQSVFDYRLTHPEVRARGYTSTRQVKDRIAECRAGSPDRWQNPGVPSETEGLARLADRPFMLLAAKEGLHMALVLDGFVYEAHSRSGCYDEELIEVTPLHCWPWNSGVMTGPVD
ncbi:MAG: hypothetical protein RMA76_33050 [Deltaproteobacteria bacterium]